MKRLGIALFWLLTSSAVLLVVVAATWVLKVGLPFKKQYSAVRIQVGEVYEVRPLAQLRMVELSDVLEHWACRIEDTNTVTMALSVAGLAPSVRNWIDMFNTPLPEFSWLDLSRTKRAATFAIAKMVFLDLSSDRTFYVSDDWSTAVLRIDETGAVYVFQDQTNAVRWGFYSER